MRPSVQLPWIFLGDFNDVLLPSGIFNHNQADIFNDNITICDLLDMELLGGKFT